MIAAKYLLSEGIMYIDKNGRYQTMTFPRADNLSSIRLILTLSGRLFRRCWSSWSVVAFGTNKPCLYLISLIKKYVKNENLFPTVTRPTIRTPAIEQ
jgi:hypothetical protein